MSCEALSWALEQNIRPSSAKFLLVIMADSAYPDGYVCLPVKFLAKVSCQDITEVNTNLRHLENHRAIIKRSEHEVARADDLIYSINLPEGGQ